MKNNDSNKKDCFVLLKMDSCEISHANKTKIMYMICIFLSFLVNSDILTKSDISFIFNIYNKFKS